jgi:hypothetical protein
MVRKTTVVFALLLLVALAAGVGAQDKGPQPLADFGQMTFDMGEVFEQDEYSHVFVVKNRGKAELLIESVKPG